MNFAIDTSLARRIGKLAVWVIVGMLFQTGVNWLDTAFVARLPGSTGIDGVAGIGVSLPIFWALGGFFSAISVGTQAITARRAGENQLEDAGRTLTNSMLVAMLTGATVSVGGYYLIPEIFPLFNPNPNVIRLGSEFLQIRMLGVFSMVATFSLKGFFDGIGKTHVHMIASIVMNLLNAILCLVLVFGWWGFPRLEVAGAAWATVISTYVGLLVMILWTLKKELRQRYRIYRFKNLNLPLVGEICRLSVFSGFATLFVMSGFGFFMWVCGHLPKPPHLLEPLGFVPVVGPVLQGMDYYQPDLATSATWVIISFLMLVFMTSMAFGTATATLVGQSLGAKDPKLAERFGWESAKIGIYVMGLLGLAVIIWPYWALRPFTPKLEVIEVAIPSMRLMGSACALMSAGLILTQAHFGAGNTRFVMIAELILHSFCLIPLSYLLAVTLGLGMIGAWLSAAIYAALLSSVMAWKFHQGRWKQIKV